MSKELYQDLYKLEPGTYFLRVSPSIMSESQIHKLEEIVYELIDSNILIKLVFAEQGSLEFIPQPEKKPKTP